ncbi:MAG TPA: hypothetical protein VH143_33815 [Kofleriaceae bacterium]|jgi:hypothetical protein|nr:hypothetical protein [Kofleriaceae bacterium]
MPLYSTADATTLLAGEAGFAYPGSGGFLELNVSGVDSIALSPAPDKAPVYGETDTPMPSLTTLPAQGTVWFGNVAPGTYDVVATPASTNCVVGSGAYLGWQPTTPGTATRVVVEDNSITITGGLDCN